MKWIYINMLLMAISNLALVLVMNRVRKDFDIMHMHLTCMMGTLLAKHDIILSTPEERKDAY